MVSFACNGGWKLGEDGVVLLSVVLFEDKFQRGVHGGFV